MPPSFCACAITCSASVVLPDDSGPKISMTRPARHAADAERIVQADRAGGNGGNGVARVFLAEAHDRALAELLLDLADGHLDGLSALAVVPIFCWGHSGDAPR